MLRLTLFDQSNFATSGLGLSLFDPKQENLPELNAGDVIALRRIHVSSSPPPLRPSPCRLTH